MGSHQTVYFVPLRRLHSRYQSLQGPIQELEWLFHGSFIRENINWPQGLLNIYQVGTGKAEVLVKHWLILLDIQSKSCSNVPVIDHRLLHSSCLSCSQGIHKALQCLWCRDPEQRKKGKSWMTLSARSFKILNSNRSKFWIFSNRYQFLYN